MQSLFLHNWTSRDDGSLSYDLKARVKQCRIYKTVTNSNIVLIERYRLKLIIYNLIE
jgi:hypothetical protein